ncbi:HAD family hydrolase [Gottfriedia acidiceleris]|uniref:HAD family hydrolase n=1 Tax=Gottfriedia acidiceleris TaxID=371036 RepID=UPI003B58B316
MASFGNGENDLDMFQASNVTFAPNNAPSFVQKVANYTVPSNDENGFLFVSDFLLSAL